jgi:hypothetical protein
MLIIGSLIGLLIGYMVFFVGENSKEETSENQNIKVVTKKIKDTVVVNKKIYVEVPVSDTLPDTLNMLLAIQDTLADTNQDTLDPIIEEELFVFLIDDNDNLEKKEEDEFEVITDKLIKKVSKELKIIESIDSLGPELVFNKEVNPFNSILMIEFWTSPLELTGYELTSKRLKLYGFNPDENLNLVYSKGTDYIRLTIGENQLKLKKTDRFKTLYL